MSKITTASLLKMKQDGQKITAITAYDASFAKLFDDEGAHVLLIGDSLGMVLQGGQDTLAVSVDEMVYHTRCVTRGASNALIIADMPFMSYATPEQTYQTAARLMAAGARMVKMEGGDWLCDSIRHLTRNGVPVCGHLGLTPSPSMCLAASRCRGVTSIRPRRSTVRRSACKKPASSCWCSSACRSPWPSASPRHCGSR